MLLSPRSQDSRKKYKFTCGAAGLALLTRMTRANEAGPLRANAAILDALPAAEVAFESATQTNAYVDQIDRERERASHSRPRNGSNRSRERVRHDSRSHAAPPAARHRGGASDWRSIARASKRARVECDAAARTPDQRTLGGGRRGGV